MKKRLFSALALGMLSMACWGQSASDNSDLIKRGEYLARAGDCVACHTNGAKGQPFAGGLAMATPIGTIYSTNITPDKTHGIGSYTFEEFDDAVRRGVRKDGSTLYPAMPFPSFARITEPDMRAMYAYFMHGVQPVAEANKDTDIPWPLSMRWPLAIWRGLFAPDPADFVSNASADPVLERGRYLVEGLGHCGACHTPRSITMQEKALSEQDGDDYLSGSSAPIDGWVASSLRGENRDGLGTWSEAEVAEFLKTGRNDKGVVFGGMSDVVEHSLQYLSDDDITAIARYLKSLPPKGGKQSPAPVADDTAQQLWKGNDSKTGAALYVDNCAACHRTDGVGYKRAFPALKGNPVVQTEDPTSLIHIILTGNTTPAVNGAVSNLTMPSFGWRLNDQQVADVANFVRSSWGNKAPAVSASDVAKVRKDRSIIADEKAMGSPDVSKLPGAAE
ncbi:c-type cytochrome [Shimwellia blattae]|uniref:Gluconate 2-dehydrogenase cytochrome c subunit n=1 Tax=Shimwellia blattae (strain ATCC 29907 / DSM 4481 / JCM 1650 / NBRC 105725 / CDC 9005-74) TaxID=630626 RepID=I2BC58_SHIBC|nr:cytochrome c [Shimwellia blattae]AFJ48112.1 gluconate 2-dehydrogenase cytochrome c subunit [Shimwellia blattae DSM 4481 = NBRC 105725]GAB81901.1 putative gluconate 2-dehydrogenase cytochrome c subunit [Shimwellia blattae DSM 4481 = NBRC 105725]VDY65611.1 Gluconate 2-dehydrogenase cytochrome c subunit precursor [Shimwellia blattae]VEC25092.1 Gluconate 2-dehydrogenase cytochrome c subunit precursor [Shimwellia blattae]